MTIPITGVALRRQKTHLFTIHLSLTCDFANPTKRFLFLRDLRHQKANYRRLSIPNNFKASVNGTLLWELFRLWFSTFEKAWTKNQLIWCIKLLYNSYYDWNITTKHDAFHFLRGNRKYSFFPHDFFGVVLLRAWIIVYDIGGFGVYFSLNELREYSHVLRKRS